MYPWNSGINRWEVLTLLFFVFGLPALVVTVAGVLTGPLARESYTGRPAPALGYG